MKNLSLNKFERYFPTQIVAKCTRVFLVYLTFYLFGIITNHYNWISPLMLGTVAYALGEMDGHWRNRLLSSIIMLSTFYLTLFVCGMVIGNQLYYGIFLVLASFSLIMLGAIVERYSLFGFCNLVILIYYSIMLGKQQLSFSFGLHFEGYLLLIGASVYALLSLLWGLLFANQPVRQSMADVLQGLGKTLKAKADLFEHTNLAQQQQNWLKMSKVNQSLVEALNQAKDTIYYRIGKARAANVMQHFLRLYFISQDVHERATSAHYDYHELAETFFYSDIMFRVQRVLRAQGNQCIKFSQDLRVNSDFGELQQSQQALLDLQRSEQYLLKKLQVSAQDGNDYQLLNSLAAIQAIIHNLTVLQNLLEKMLRVFNLAGTSKVEELQDKRIHSSEPRTWRKRWQRLVLSFSLQSPVFRHAVRISLALGVGYFVMQSVGNEQGFWILLTVLFVCRSGLAATKTRVFGRVAGTIIGLFIGWMLLQVFHIGIEQMAIAIVSGVLVFAFTQRNYTISTSAVTVMVLMCFNQSSDSFGLIIPRLIDTVIGAAISLAVVYFVLPDWLQKNRLTKVIANALSSNKIYLNAVLQQYFSGGKQDDMLYRVARRNAHNADAALSVLTSALVKEPKISQLKTEHAMRQQVVLHTMLNYVSGLAAHRQQIEDSPLSQQLFQLGNYLTIDLQNVANSIEHNSSFVLANCQSVKLLEQIKQQYNDDEVIADDLASLLFNQLEYLVETVENIITLTTVDNKTKLVGIEDV